MDVKRHHMRMPRSLQNIRDDLFTGDAFDLRLILRLLTALEVALVLFCLHAHVIVQLYPVLHTDIINLEQILAL